MKRISGFLMIALLTSSVALAGKGKTHAKTEKHGTTDLATACKSVQDCAEKTGDDLTTCLTEHAKDLKGDCKKAFEAAHKEGHTEHAE